MPRRREIRQPELTYLEWWSKLVKEVGFPIVVAGVLLYFLLAQMPMLRDSMIVLTKTLEKVAHSLEGLTHQQDELADIIKDERKSRNKFWKKLADKEEDDEKER